MPLSNSRGLPVAPVALAAALVFSPPATMAQDFDMGVQVDGLEFTPLSDLPTNVAELPVTENCLLIIDDPQTAPARLVAQQGWAVTGEHDLSGLTFVSFVGSFEQYPGDSCGFDDGRVAIFRGQMLLGLIGPSDPAIRSIGRITSLEGGGLRIEDADALHEPIADLLVLATDLVVVRHVADRDSLCGGAISAPNLRRMPIRTARRVLAAEGWAPFEDPEAGEVWGYQPEALKRQLPELVECESTGIGYCVFAYRKDAGPILKVVTFGTEDEAESESVVRFYSDCEP